MKPDEVQNFLNGKISEFKRKALNVIKEEAPRSIRKNFEQGGRPEWKPSQKKGKLKGTKTLIVSRTLMSVSAKANKAESSVTVSTNPRAGKYAKIQNEGGTINVPAKPLKFRQKKYKDGRTRTVFASKKHKKIVKETTSKPYKITIPKREFMNIPDADLNGIVSKINQIKL